MQTPYVTDWKDEPDYWRFGYIPERPGTDVERKWERIRGYPNLYKRLQAEDIMRALHIEPDDVVLDFGCGHGFFTVEMARLAQEAVGIDTDQYLDRLRVPAELEGKLRFIRCSGTRLPFPDGYFTKILASEVLPMLPDPRPFMEEIYRVLAPRGTLVVVGGVGHIPIKRAFEKRPFYFRWLCKRYPERMPGTYDEYCAILQKSFGTSRNHFIQLEEYEAVLRAGGFRILRVVSSPSSIVGQFFSWRQFLMYLRSGKTLTQQRFNLFFPILWSLNKIWPVGSPSGRIIVARSQKNAGMMTQSQPRPAVLAQAQREATVEEVFDAAAQRVEQGDVSGAINTLKTIATGHAAQEKAYLFLGKLQELTGDLQSARKTYSDGLLVHPASTELAERLELISVPMPPPASPVAAPVASPLETYRARRAVLHSAPYPLHAYENCLRQLALRVPHRAFTDSGPGPCFYVRHDIDTPACVERARLLLDADRAQGMRPGIYIRVDGDEYAPELCRDLVREYSELEFGLHTTCYLHDDYLGALRQEVERFTSIFGFAPRSFTVHGMGEHRLDVRNQFVQAIGPRMAEFGFTLTDCVAAIRRYEYVIEDCHRHPETKQRIIYDDFVNPPQLPGARLLVLAHPCYWDKAAS